MPARNIKRYIAVAAAAVSIGFAGASFGLANAASGATVSGSGTHSAVLCATAIEYGLIAA